MRMRRGEVRTTRVGVRFWWRIRIRQWKQERARIVLRAARNLRMARRALERYQNDGSLSSYTECLGSLEFAQDGVRISWPRLERDIRDEKEGPYYSPWCVACRFSDACDCHVL